ncbi:winged helix family transcriptional regulator [Kribbella antibiotica]|uniref:Winged helix family transcriptional regulator n=1 Tax=Kribbella antibiotica TaxID=190195 RepID=A0A4R4ZFS7_9ACTN|nr:winged helix-turn-helix domain-containing protein [Kribbella antibiotica]TDD56890.1 winged helix family transcriptional regulator [Kribbella antibiotica]
MERTSESSLIIGVATSTAERVQLARLLGDADALLLVSSAEQARAFLELTETMTPTAPVVMAPSVVPAPEPASLEPELLLDMERRVVRWEDREVPLTRLEHDFLHCLVEEPGQVWTYQRLHHAVWGNEHLGHGSHIHSVVKRLRQKLANLEATVTIHAVRGVGFHLLPTA